MTQGFVLDRRIVGLVKKILSEAAAKGAKELQTWKRPQREINQLFERDYADQLRATFGSGEIKSLVRLAAAIWPNFNRSHMGPPSMELFAEVSGHLPLVFSSAPYRKR